MATNAKQARTEYVMVRLTPKEKADAAAVAVKQGITLSTYVRHRLLGIGRK